MPLPFEQQPRESDKAFAAFNLYLSLGAERSLAAVAQQLSKSEQLLKRWSAKFDWPARVQAHSAHLAVVERQAAELLARTKAAEWIMRRETVRDEEWAMHQEALAAGREALKRFYERGKGATLGDIARILELASKLGRLAAGMATDKHEVTGEDGGPIQVELTAALNKIYGPDTAEVVDVEAVKLPPPEKEKS